MCCLYNKTGLNNHGFFCAQPMIETREEKVTKLIRAFAYFVDDRQETELCLSLDKRSKLPAFYLDGYSGYRCKPTERSVKRLQSPIKKEMFT